MKHTKLRSARKRLIGADAVMHRAVCAKNLFEVPVLDGALTV